MVYNEKEDIDMIDFDSEDPFGDDDPFEDTKAFARQKNTNTAKSQPKKPMNKKAERDSGSSMSVDSDLESEDPDGPSLSSDDTEDSDTSGSMDTDESTNGSADSVDSDTGSDEKSDDLTSTDDTEDDDDTDESDDSDDSDDSSYDSDSDSDDSDDDDSDDDDSDEDDSDVDSDDDDLEDEESESDAEDDDDDDDDADVAGGNNPEAMQNRLNQIVYKSSHNLGNDSFEEKTSTFGNLKQLAKNIAHEVSPRISSNILPIVATALFGSNNSYFPEATDEIFRSGFLHTTHSDIDIQRPVLSKEPSHRLTK